MASPRPSKNHSLIVAFRLLSEIPPDATEAIEGEAHHLGEWLGSVRMIPRFRTPLERELTG